MLSGLVKTRKQRANFRLARQPGVIAITSYKPTSRYLSACPNLDYSGWPTTRPESCWWQAGNTQVGALSNSDLSSHAVNQLLGIVADPSLKHRLDVLDLVNSF
jgi:hypothetical protein